MTKEEKIKEAWGEYWNKLPNEVQEKALKNNGFVSQYFENLLTIDKRERKLFEIRPKSLQGIETNNGWVKIESEEDLPKLNGTYFTITRHDNKIRIEIIATQHLYKKDLEWYKNHYAYYQPIETPKPPIY